jgi:ankyrin repeat protein
MASFGLGRPDAAAPLAGHPAVDASTPWVAAADGNLPLLEAALSHLQLTVNAQDENGYTFLQAAASYNRMHVLEWIVQQQQQQQPPGADCSLVDADGDSALHYASTATVARFLVTTAGVNPNLLNGEGLTALQRKRQELEEAQQDEDFDEEDEDYQQLQALVAYLASLSTVSQ